MFCCSSGKGKGCCTGVAACARAFFSLIAFVLLLPFIVTVKIFTFCFLREGDIFTSLCREKNDFFRGKVALVTGATSGIGRSLVIHLAKRGCKVIVSGRRPAAVTEVANECRAAATEQTKNEVPMVEELLLDVSKLDTIDEAVRKALGFYGQIDFLFNNAGMGVHPKHGQCSPFEIDQLVVNTNFVAPVKITKCLMSHFIEKSTPSHIVNVSSVSAYFPFPGNAMYSATKRALYNYFASLEMEAKIVAPLSASDSAASGCKLLACCRKWTCGPVGCCVSSGRKIHVTNVFPGWINTEFYRQLLVNKECETNQSKLSQFASGMSADRCAELMLRVTSNGVQESWIAKQPELTAMYIFHYVPGLMRCCLPLMLKVALWIGAYGFGEDEEKKTQ